MKQEDHLEAADIDSVRLHLRAQYRGVLPDDEFERQLADSIGLTAARELLDLATRRIEPGAQILDVGAGYGSFVLAARERGYDAVGAEVESFETSFANRRLGRAGGNAVRGAIVRASGLELPFARNTFDAVTLWNVLEHVADLRPLLQETARVLRPGGHLFALCPNYASFRREAHYLLFLPPLLPRPLASVYLRLRGRKPHFFERHIHYRTNREILRELTLLGFELIDLRLDRIANPRTIRDSRLRLIATALERTGMLAVTRALLSASFRNPFRRTVSLCARKTRSR
jgi:SAM-dependent methyltransferase